jgi:hypothetical protein
MAEKRSRFTLQMKLCAACITTEDLPRVDLFGTAIWVV